MILAGDVGGTKTRLGLFHASSKSMLLKRSRTLSSTAFQSLEDIVDEFLLEDETIAAACFGVAGPVVSGSAIATNLPWNVSVKSLQHKLSIGSVSIVNDLVSNAYGIDVMQGRDFTTLNRGRKIIGNKAILSARDRTRCRRHVLGRQAACPIPVRRRTCGVRPQEPP